MDVNAERSRLIEELQQINDLSLIRAMTHMVHYALYKEGRISIEQYNRELKEAEDRVKSGDFFTQEDVEKLFKE